MIQGVRNRECNYRKKDIVYKVRVEVAVNVRYLTFTVILEVTQLACERGHVCHLNLLCVGNYHFQHSAHLLLHTHTNSVTLCVIEFFMYSGKTINTAVQMTQVESNVYWTVHHCNS